MKLTRILLATLAGTSMMALAACNDATEPSAPDDDPAVRTQPLAPQADDAAPETDTPTDTQTDTMQRLRDAAGQARDEAGRLAGEARRAAEDAYEDAGPMLNRAGEIAGRIGASINELAERARVDLERAARALDQRVAEATDDTTPDEPAGDPAALLGPADELNADTRAAARASMAGVGPAFVGAYAADAASCARIDREPLELFAVVTPTTLRRYESVCNIEAGDADGDNVTVAASCMVEGDMEERQIMFDTSEPDTLRIVQGAESEGVDLVRCSLP